MDSTLAVQALAALAHPIRLAAFRALVVAGEDGLAQKALAEQVGVGPTNLAFHLKELAAVGLVRPGQSGRFVIYRAGFGPMNELIAYLTENCCAGASCTAKVETAACAC